MQLELWNKVIYVDCDGTLLGPSLDQKYELMLNAFKRIPMAADFAHKAANWIYAKFWRKSNLPLNIELLSEMKHMKEEGYVFILWTNRFPENESMTKKNLGQWVELFDGFEFHSAKKVAMHKVAIGASTWDDKAKHVAGPMGRHVRFMLKGGE
jgi:hypothetical protein